MKHRIINVIKMKYKGSTLPEILIVIILSGILFLLLFDGMNIVNTYNLILRNRLITKNELFYSHSILEFIMEETDSIRLSYDEQTLFFYRAGEVRHTLLLNNKGIQVLYKELRDTIFINNSGWKLHYLNDSNYEIDSITIIAPIENDTLTLEYGLSSIQYLINTKK